MKEQHWCGMTAKTGSVLSGVFSIIATDLYLIFEEKHIKSGRCAGARPQHAAVNSMAAVFLRCWLWTAVLLTSFVTFAVSLFFLYSVYAQKFQGLVIYAIWIPLFEAINTVVQIATRNDTSLVEAKALRWFGLLSRVLAHCFWMFFVVAYAHKIYKSKSQGNILSYNRRISMGSGEFPRRKSNLISFTRRYNE
ncbi:transmembrane protein 217 isoform X1 [Dasypus novemcinctus]|uniref:transmembrane protein 217 isoform X1 n=1 Tax=Dasypus novemcinctus TaxID=9361 RepID=UPI0003CC0798|nr:transmembrane protein 217 isoform X1 [Dasypus novemcinctus]